MLYKLTDQFNVYAPTPRMLKALRVNKNVTFPANWGTRQNIPVVFVTSKIDSMYSNAINIAHALAQKGKNDVYLLKLGRSNHATYMFDDCDDHDRYETFIHAIYKKYIHCINMTMFF